jgi:hypothetical protein
MKNFRYYLLNKFRTNNPNFKFNTTGLGFKDSTFFYLSSDGIYSFKTYSKLDQKDHRIILNYLYTNRDKILRNYEDMVESEQISKNIFRVNTSTYQARNHIEAIKRYWNDYGNLTDSPRRTIRDNRST